MVDNHVSTGSPERELRAMEAISRTVSELEREEAGRVLRWAMEVYGVAPRQKHPAPANGADGPQDYGDVAELYQSVVAPTQADKVLVVSYWFQQINHQSDLDAQQVNRELKQLGHGVSNITSVFEELISRKPQLAIQTRKSGNTRQARKKYRLTREGINRVRGMLTGETNE
jgi:hypothetical protein